MTTSLVYWKNVYRELKHRAVCVDIERSVFNGPISVVGVYRPRDGVVKCEQFVRGRNLTAQNLRTAFNDAKLLITYNGVHHDAPAIEAEFGNVFAPDRLILDLYLITKRFQVNASLKTWENTLGIERWRTGVPGRTHPIRLWQRYARLHDEKALGSLLEYNREDTVNLYPLAEEFMKFVDDAGHHAGDAGVRAGPWHVNSF